MKPFARNAAIAATGLALAAAATYVNAPGFNAPADQGAAADAAISAPSRQHENALESAESYLDSLDFSQAGLIDQLSSPHGDQYPQDVAEWAVAHVQADWNAEALGSARSYLDSGSFSDAELHDQLTSEAGDQFTPEQADFAIAHLGR